MYKKIAVLLLTTISTVIQIILVICAIGTIAFVAFLIDPNFAQNFSGNDTLSAFNYVVWMDKTFPFLYFWYPTQGSGVSFTAGYQWIAHLLVILTSHLIHIPLTAAFATVRAASFFITAVGIILYCWTRLEYPRQKFIRILLGTVAAFFFLVAPITWYWTHKWGFYAESVSYLFIPFTLIFADWYINLQFRQSEAWYKRIVLIIAGIFWSLGFQTHFYTGTGLAHFIALLIAGQILLNFKKYGKNSVIIGIKTGCALIAVLLIFTSWRLYSYFDYSHQVAKGGFVGDIFNAQNAKNLNKPSLKQITQLEFIAFPDNRFIFDGYSAPLTIWIFALISLLLGWIRSKKILIAGVALLYGFLSYSVTEVINATYWLGPFAQIVNFRSVWTVYRILLPISAAYGIFIIADLLLTPPDFLLRKLSKITGFLSHQILKPLATTALIIIIGAYVTYSIEVKRELLGYKLTTYNSPVGYLEKPDIAIIKLGIRTFDTTNIWGAARINYGNTIKSDPIKIRFDQTGLKTHCQSKKPLDEMAQSLCAQLNSSDIPKDAMKKALSYCQKLSRDEIKGTHRWCDTMSKPLAWQLDYKNWPKITFPNTNVITKDDIESLSHIPDKPLETRYDLSGVSGSIIMRAPLISTASMTQVYINQLSLYSALWNYQSSVMYSAQPTYQKPGVLTQLAKYFGYEYINAVTNAQSASDLYTNDPHWEKLAIGTWWKFKEPTTLATLTEKPAVLTITYSDKFLYDQLFKIANIGALSYDDAILYKGSRYLDDYSLEDLSKFKMLYLAGYQYHNIAKAHTLLNDYVKQGGNLFIDTGWQYNNPDWNAKELPSVFPANRFEWKPQGSTAKMTLVDTQIIGYTPPSKSLGTLALANQEWGVSASTDIRVNAKVLLQIQDAPIMTAQTNDRGRIIWSGFNIVPHIEGGRNENQGEIALLQKTFQWLLHTDDEIQYPNHQLAIKRFNPDKVTFTIRENIDNPTQLYWRESFHPKWHATLKNNGRTTNIHVFPAGPRLMGMLLPKELKKDCMLTLEVKDSPQEVLLFIATWFGIFSVILYIFNLHKYPIAAVKKKLQIKHSHKIINEPIPQENNGSNDHE